MWAKSSPPTGASAPPGLEGEYGGAKRRGLAAGMADLRLGSALSASSLSAAGHPGAHPPSLDLAAPPSMAARVRQQATVQQKPQAPPLAQACHTSGEWVNAVLAAAPYLNSDGLKEALAILDKAIGNIQQIKAMDGIISSTYMAGGFFTAMPHLHAAEHMKAQVFEQQQILLRQLHGLRASSAAAPRQGSLNPATAAAVLEHMKSTQLRAQHNMQQGGPKPFLDDERLVAMMAHELRLPPDAPLPRGLPPNRWLLEQHALARGQAAGRPPHAAAAPHRGVAGAEALHGPARQVQTLSTSLQMLANEDPDCLFIVRRINKLGFKAARKLKQHFSSCGSVVRVLVAHSTVRQHGDPQCHPRRRPSSLGFVHMSTAEAVVRVLALGDEQKVEGSLIRVQRFERQRHAESIEEEEEEELLEEIEDDTVEDLQDDEAWKRQQSTFSTKSTLADDDNWKRQQSAISIKSSISLDDEDWKRQQSAISAASGKSASSRGTVSTKSTWADDDNWKRQQSAISIKSSISLDDEEWKRQQSAISAASGKSASSGDSGAECFPAEEPSEQ